MNLEHLRVHVDLPPRVDHRIGVQREGDARHDEEEEGGDDDADERIGGGQAGPLLLVRERAAEGQVGAVEDEDEEDRDLARVPVPVRPPHDARPERPGHRRQEAEDEADLDRRGGGTVVLDPPAQEVAEAPERRHEEGDEGRPGQGDVEEEDAARLADEAGGERRVEEGGPDRHPHPEPEQPEPESFHGFHTSGNSISPAMVMTASYRRS